MYCRVILVFVLWISPGFSQDSWKWSGQLAAGISQASGESWDTGNHVQFKASIDLSRSKNMFSLFYFQNDGDFRHRGTSQIDYDLEQSGIILGYTRAIRNFLIGGGLGDGTFEETRVNSSAGLQNRGSRKHSDNLYAVWLGFQITRHMDVQLRYTDALTHSAKDIDDGFIHNGAISSISVEVGWRFGRGPAKGQW